MEGTRTVSQQHDQQVEDRRADFQKLAQSIEDGRRAAESLAQRVDEGRKNMHATNSRLESLIDLQESALKHDDRYQEWLVRRGLSHAPRLAEEVKVADGWEAAADALLGNRLAGLGVGSIENTIADETALPASNLFLLSPVQFPKLLMILKPCRARYAVHAMTCSRCWQGFILLKHCPKRCKGELL